MPLNVSIHDDGKKFTLLEQITYDTPNGTIVIPEGFITDFASIPRILWSIYPPTGRYQRAAVIHDWLYICHYSGRSPFYYSLTPNYGEHPNVFKARRASLAKDPFNIRANCDALFLQIMKESGVSFRTRYTLYLAVHLFAGWLWKTGTYKDAV